ncbi:hypothetical protein A374_07421 [Fictibacillus macauensis ZFHKF-1]|uniref:DUF370 domain-containing protein n=1 Tax=Fictibacillus macauensis ZFHKF-1 TaxID=1196324 RepID=I8AJZ8_9BACL|nr:extracellular matrix/biofilm biosynthesis regulator RemA family protein [Fictibacillus macauensis]EIT86132.1 hypothetical protein A374_07421 [Fictibacillus macauensis ZFHKF-1]
MLLHIGEDAVIQQKEIIAILDYQAMEDSDCLPAFLQKHKAEKSLVQLSELHPKSLIITKKHVYISPLSSMTLKKRAEERVDFAHSWYLK